MLGESEAIRRPESVSNTEGVSSPDGSVSSVSRREPKLEDLKMGWLGSRRKIVGQNEALRGSWRGGG